MAFGAMFSVFASWRADCGGDCNCWIRCNGDGASSGAELGWDERAESFVTAGCLRCESFRTRSGRGVVFDRLTAAGFSQISHSGSRSSRWSGWPGVVRPTTIVIESVSDSKLCIEVGVIASCCTCRFMDARGLSLGDAVGFWTKRFWPLSLATSSREKVLCSGDFSGAVFDLCSFFERGTDDARGDGALLLLVLVLGKSDSRGEGEGTTGDVALRWSL
jgi:hypothetical protein